MLTFTETKDEKTKGWRELRLTNVHVLNLVNELIICCKISTLLVDFPQRQYLVKGSFIADAKELRVITDSL